MLKDIFPLRSCYHVLTHMQLKMIMMKPLAVMATFFLNRVENMFYVFVYIYICIHIVQEYLTLRHS